MAGWIVAIVIVVVIVIVAAVLLSARAKRQRQQRTENLRGKFGPEYDRTLESADGQKEAEADLQRRTDQRERLDIRPLSPAARDRFAGRWEDAQRRFVDDPALAIAEADALVREVMGERGYPVDDFDRRADDLSVDHPHLVENFRGASSIAYRSRRESISTEDQRQAMVHFRGLFDELLVSAPGDEPGPGTATHEPAPREGERSRSAPPAREADRPVGERPQNAPPRS